MSTRHTPTGRPGPPLGPARARRGSERGSATVELVLLSPLLIALGLFVVLCGRLVSAQLDVDAAAHSAARAASLAHNPSTAYRDALAAATDTLTGRAVACQSVEVVVDTAGMRPDGAVTVSVTCRVGLGDLALLGVPGSRAITARSTVPVDRFRGVG